MARLRTVWHEIDSIETDKIQEFINTEQRLFFNSSGTAY